MFCLVDTRCLGDTQWFLQERQRANRHGVRDDREGRKAGRWFPRHRLQPGRPVSARRRSTLPATQDAQSHLGRRSTPGRLRSVSQSVNNTLKHTLNSFISTRTKRKEQVSHDAR